MPRPYESQAGPALSNVEWAPVPPTDEDNHPFNPVDPVILSKKITGEVNGVLTIRNPRLD
jgi:hypothetical protein